MSQRTTDIKSSKIELAKLILDIENPELIRKIHEMIMHEAGDFWHSLSDDEKKEVHIGISQLNKGERISFDEYIKKVS